MSQVDQADVVSHWSKLYENFSTSSEQFYENVEIALDHREVPYLRTATITWSESGILSPNRAYLRVFGDRLVFDICAAPFGTGFFFSWWLTRRRSEFALAYLALLLPASWYLYKTGFQTIGFLLRHEIFHPPLWLAYFVASPFFLIPATVLFVLAFAAMCSRASFYGFEDAVMRVPGVSWLYVKLFAPDTYYRRDTVAMFRAAVQAAVNEVLEDLLRQKGLRVLRPDGPAAELATDGGEHPNGEVVLAEESVT